MPNFSPPTSRQIRAARAILDWSVHELGAKIGVAGTTISSIERNKINGSIQTLRAISTALESAGIEFLPDEGVRPASNRIRVLKGKMGLETFYNEVYAAAMAGDPKTRAITRRTSQFRQWIGDFVMMHRQRMEELHLDKRGQIGHYLYPDTHIDNIPVNYEEVRYVPAEKFPDVSIHIHGDKVTTIEFFDNDVEIIITDNPTVANSFRKIFDMIWEGASLTPLSLHRGKG